MRNKTIYLISLILFFTCCQRNVEDEIKDTYWQKDNPLAHGLNPDSLQKAVDNAGTLSNFYALLVVRNDKLLLETYFNQKNANDLFHLRSITKNFTSALTGISLSENPTEDPDSPIKPYFDDILQDEKSSMTYRHLLNMASGLKWEENVEINNLLAGQIRNPVDWILSRELDSNPGNAFNYNSLLPHVISHIISQRENRNYLDYAQEKLFSPLDIQQFNWDRDPEGLPWGGFGLQLHARDVAKFGQLYLNGGTWAGNQIVPSAWVTQSSQAQVEFANGSGYSFQWWISGTFSEKIYYGQGYGGQTLMLLPERNMQIIALQEYFVNSDKSTEQWSGFIHKVLPPVLNSIE